MWQSSYLIGYGGAMDIQREQRDVLEAMGVALLLVQNAERVIRLCMTVVLPKQAPITLDSLQQQEDSERSKTIGYFLCELRKRASIDEDFDLLLVSFLKNRNDFVHDLSRVPAWGLRTTEQTESALQFVHMLLRQADEVLKVFAGLLLAWQERNGMSMPMVPEHEWFSEVNATYKHLATQLFGRHDE